MGSLSKLLLRFTSTVLAQTVHTTACTRYHTLEQQFSRWTLMILDRLSSERVAMADETIGAMLGANADTLARVITNLEQDGVLEHRSGEVRILSRAGLERHVCHCYSSARQELNQALPYTDSLEDQSPENTVH